MSLFYNKRVCIIGPAPNLINSNLGNFIDSYDIVCRINSSYIIKDNLIKDYGKKCDILLSSCNLTLCSAIKKNIKYLNNCKMIINPTKTYHTGEKKEAEYFIKKATNNKIKFLQIDEKWYLKKIKKFKNLNTGLLSIFYLLEQNPKELFIAGFSFYEKKNIEDNYIFNHKKTYENNPKNLPNCKNGKLLEGDKTKILKTKYLNNCKLIFKKFILSNEKVNVHESIKILLE